ncbi:hypothetical protein V6N12_051156 [Hibiscus sabdariffa]|uniref:Uncharacterized protein n=1 Tax=Hibiscus sabdariffa TaxID=183260 RepID=A0ABR2GEI5_9ROSI
MEAASTAASIGVHGLYGEEMEHRFCRNPCLKRLQFWVTTAIRNQGPEGWLKVSEIVDGLSSVGDFGSVKEWLWSRCSMVGEMVNVLGILREGDEGNFGKM